MFRLLNTAIGGNCSMLECLKNREDLSQRLDSKSMLGEYSETLYTTCGPFICNENMISDLFQYVMKSKSSTDCLLVAELLELLSKSCTFLFAHSIGLMKDWARALCSQLVTGSKSANVITCAILKYLCTVIKAMCHTNAISEKNDNIDEGIGLAVSLFEHTLQVRYSDIATVMAEVGVYTSALSGCVILYNYSIIFSYSVGHI